MIGQDALNKLFAVVVAMSPQAAVAYLDVLKILAETDDDEATVLTDTDLALLSASIARLKALVNDPIALMGRARDLLEGRAQPILSSLPLGLGAAKLLFALGVAALAAFDVPSFQADDWARMALTVGWIERPSIHSILAP